MCVQAGIVHIVQKAYLNTESGHVLVCFTCKFTLKLFFKEIGKILSLLALKGDVLMLPSWAPSGSNPRSLFSGAAD